VWRDVQTLGHSERLLDRLKPHLTHDVAERAQQLSSLSRLSPQELATQYRSALGIVYRAPADTGHLDRVLGTPAPVGPLDYHISHWVDEHVPPDALKAMLRDAKRFLKPDGLFLHHVDLSDHFADSDPAIPRCHFLRYSEREWTRLAGNRYAYHNRLRADELRTLIEAAGIEILAWDERLDDRSLQALQGGFPVATRWRGQAPERLAVDGIWWVGRPRAPR